MASIALKQNYYVHDICFSGIIFFFRETSHRLVLDSHGPIETGLNLSTGKGSGSRSAVAGLSQRNSD